jgi:hypothetical protein
MHQHEMKGSPMTTMKGSSLAILFFLTIFLQPFLVQGGELKGQKAAKGAEPAAISHSQETAVYPAMPSPGKKVPIGSDHYIIYGFDKKPKLGTIIIKVEIFDRNDKKDASFAVLADSGMPSMKGAHETGEQQLQLSKKGAYLLPVNIVMPGDWEIRITIKKDGKVLFRGSHQFDV